MRCETTDVADGSRVNFVARTAENNGVVACIKRIGGINPHPAGTLSCAAHGSVMSSFVQLHPYYSGRALYVLTPRHEMSLQEKLYYCMCLKTNAYRYNYGRSAEKTLRDLELPNTIPDWVYTTSVEPIKTRHSPHPHPVPDVEHWGGFMLDELFSFRKGKRLRKEDMLAGETNYLGAISENNGIRQLIDAPAIFEPNCITVNYNGSVGETFYQSVPFWASDDVNVLYSKGWIMNKYVALFVSTVIKANRYKFSYGRKWTLEQMRGSIIKLPITPQGVPDWGYMEGYIKSLPYADRI
jgi:hypothetical protein